MSEAEQAKNFEQAVNLAGYEAMKDTVFDVTGLFVAIKSESEQEHRGHYSGNNFFEWHTDVVTVCIGDAQADNPHGFGKDFIEIRLTYEEKYRKRAIPFMAQRLVRTRQILNIKSFVGDTSPEESFSDLDPQCAVKEPSVHLESDGSPLGLEQEHMHIERAAKLIGRAIEFNCPELYTPVFRVTDFYANQT